MLKIKLVLIILAILFIFTSSLWAGPFLICDPQANVESYNIYVDDILTFESVPAQADGSLLLDIGTMAPAAYNFTARACNIWGCSDPSNPYISPSAAAKPQNLKLTE